MIVKLVPGSQYTVPAQDLFCNGIVCLSLIVPGWKLYGIDFISEMDPLSNQAQETVIDRG